MKARKRNSNDDWEEVEYVQLKNSYVITKADQMEFNIPHKKGQTEDKHWQDVCLVEKQSEHKSADKVKPKFKVGDWITDGQLICKVLSVISKFYELHLCNDDNCHFETDVQSVDKHYHLWTIQDAKPGDILSNGRMVVIFKEFEEPSYREHIVAYIGLDEIGVIQITDGTWELGTDKVNPATKEQRDLLFQKMREAGYEWDAEKKEPKKIEDEFKNYKQQVMSEITDLVTEYIKQKPTKWRPSNAQIGALEHFVRGIGESGHVSPYDVNLKLVHSLLNDLKKLK